jgi:Mg-chelatase subunit ChlD
MAYNENELAIYPPAPEYAPPGWFFGDPVPPSSRWESAYEGVEEFLNELDMSALQEKVSLVTYSSSASLDQSLTTEYSLILQDLDLRFNSFQGGGTNITSGLTQAAAALSDPAARELSAKVIVLMTDGRITSGGGPGWFVEDQAAKGVTTVTLSFSDEADIDLMKTLATKGKGFHIHAANKNDLKHAFREIVRRLPTILTK